MKILPIGTTGVASRDLECMAFTIKRGTPVTITGISPSRGYELKDVSGKTIIETGFNSIVPALPIGTTGVASRDLECMAFTLKRGTPVTITGISPSRGYELTDESGRTIIETWFDSIIPDSQDE